MRMDGGCDFFFVNSVVYDTSHHQHQPSFVLRLSSSPAPSPRASTSTHPSPSHQPVSPGRRARTVSVPDREVAGEPTSDSSSHGVVEETFLVVALVDRKDVSSVGAPINSGQTRQVYAGVAYGNDTSAAGRVVGILGHSTVVLPHRSLVERREGSGKIFTWMPVTRPPEKHRDDPIGRMA